MRVGYGYDIHRLRPGRHLILGGVELQHPTGLDGHSDADVLLHAVIDALLGASGLGDIGGHFPDAEPKWRGASSLDLLARTNKLIRTAGYSVVNVDATVVAEAPRIAPTVPEMRARISDVLGIDTSLVNIKATTAEGSGPEGRGEAISARAVALLQLAG